MSMAQKRGSRRSAYRALSRSMPPLYNNARRGRINDGVIHTYKRSVFTEDFITSDLIGQVAGALSFKLSDISTFTSMQALYDQYRINNVTVTFIPKTTVYTNTTATALNSPAVGLFGSCLDFDSGQTPINMQDLANYDTFKWTRGTDVHKRYLKPRVQITAGNVAAFSTNGQQWIDCGSPSIPHFGVRWVAEDAETNKITYDLIVKYDISFRNSR